MQGGFYGKLLIRLRPASEAKAAYEGLGTAVILKFGRAVSLRGLFKRLVGIWVPNQERHS